jgi:hypothetical protein
LYPDVNFLVYHSGFITGQPEGPYDPGRGEGVDELIRSVEESGVAKNANVYAELGSTWRFALRDPTMAAHILGKLVKHIGEENSASWSSTSARRTCSTAPTASGTARPRTRSRRCAASRSPRSCRSATAIPP